MTIGDIAAAIQPEEDCRRPARPGPSQALDYGGLAGSQLPLMPNSGRCAGAFLYAGLVDHSPLSSGRETIRPVALIQFHGRQIADSGRHRLRVFWK